MYKVLFGKYDPNTYEALAVCPYHAAVYLRNAPYTGHVVVKEEEKEKKDCRCCGVSESQRERALSTPKEEYMSFLLENV